MHLTTELPPQILVRELHVGELYPVQLRRRRVHPEDALHVGNLASTHGLEGKSDHVDVLAAALDVAEAVVVEEAIRQKRVGIRGRRNRVEPSSLRTA